VLLPGSWTVEVAAAPPTVRLRPELAFRLHQAPDPGAVGTEVWLDVDGRRTDGGQVDVEQLHAPLQRRRDRPAQLWVVPSPHPEQTIEQVFEIPIGNATDGNRTDRWGTLGAQSTGLRGSTADNLGKGSTW